MPGPFSKSIEQEELASLRKIALELSAYEQNLRANAAGHPVSVVRIVNLDKNQLVERINTLYTLIRDLVQSNDPHLGTLIRSLQKIIDSNSAPVNEVLAKTLNEKTKVNILTTSDEVEEGKPSVAKAHMKKPKVVLKQDLSDANISPTLRTRMYNQFEVAVKRLFPISIEDSLRNLDSLKTKSGKSLNLDCTIEEYSEFERTRIRESVASLDRLIAGLEKIQDRAQPQEIALAAAKANRGIGSSLLSDRAKFDKYLSESFSDLQKLRTEYAKLKTELGGSSSFEVLKGNPTIKDGLVAVSNQGNSRIKLEEIRNQMHLIKLNLKSSPNSVHELSSKLSNLETSLKLITENEKYLFGEMRNAGWDVDTLFKGFRGAAGVLAFAVLASVVLDSSEVRAETLDSIPRREPEVSTRKGKRKGESL